MSGTRRVEAVLSARRDQSCGRLKPPQSSSDALSPECGAAGSAPVGKSPDAQIACTTASGVTAGFNCWARSIRSGQVADTLAAQLHQPLRVITVPQQPQVHPPHRQSRRGLTFCAGMITADSGIAANSLSRAALRVHVRGSSTLIPATSRSGPPRGANVYVKSTPGDDCGGASRDRSTGAVRARAVIGSELCGCALRRAD
jgi:hypothetical protein